MEKSISLKLNLQPNLNIDIIRKSINQIENALRQVGKNLKIDGLDAIADDLNKLSKLDLNQLENEFSQLDNEVKNTDKNIEDLETEIDKLNKKKIKIPIEQPDKSSLPDGVTTDKNGRLRKNGKYWKDPNAIDDDVNNDKTTKKSGSGISGGTAIAGAALAGGAIAAAAGLKAVIDIGKEYQASLADFSAITGVQGKALDEFGNKARDLAKQFGTSATDQINSYKGILSRLGPDIAKSPEALNQMAISVNTLAKASGLDATTSMEALTTAALQFGVDLSNPIEAAKAMEEQMNILAAGAQFGAAEIPSVSEAITVAGVAAKGAKVSFAETNSAIQTLAAGGKYGAEAGTALRNVLGLLQKQSGEGEKELAKLGTSTLELGQKIRSEGLGSALEYLNGKLATVKDETERTQITMQLFGTENSAAAGILLQNAGAMGELTKKLEGTNTAFDQAKTNMNTFAASFDQMKATVEDLALDVFQTIAPVLQPLLSAITDSILPAIKPVLDTVGNLIKDILPIITTVITDIVKGLAPIIDLVANLLGEAIINIFKIIEPLLPPLMEYLGLLFKVLMPIVDILLELAQTVLKQVVEIFMQLLPILSVLAPLLYNGIYIALQVLVPIIQVVVIAIGEFISGILWLINSIDDFVKWIYNLNKSLNDMNARFLGFKSAVDAVGKVLKIVGEGFKALWQLIVKVASVVGKAIAEFLHFEDIANLIKRVAKSIGDFFSYIYNKVKNFFDYLGSNIAKWIAKLSAFAKEIMKFLGLLDDEDNKTKKSSNSRKKQNKELDNSKKIIKDTNKEIKEQNDLQNENAAATNKSTKSNKAKAQSLLEIFELTKKANDNALSEIEIEKERQLALEEREKNIYDEVELLKLQQNTVEANIAKFKELLVDKDGKIGVTLETSEMEKATEILRSLELEAITLGTQEKQLATKVAIDVKDYAKKVKELEEKRINSNLTIDLEFENEERLLKEYNDNITEIENKIKEKNLQLEVATISEGYKKAIKTELLNLGNELIAVQDNINKIYDKRQKEQIEKINANYDKQLKDLNAFIDKQSKIASKVLENLNKSFESQTDDKLEKELANIDKYEQEKISLLDAQREADLISEETYQQNKQKIIDNAENERLKKQTAADNKKKALQLQTNGFEFEQQREKELKLLTLQQDKLKKELELTKDPSRRAEIEKDLTLTTLLIQDKADLLTAYSEKIQEGLTDIFGNMFIGDIEGMKDGFRNVLAVAAGGLEKLAAATATSIILGQLNLTGATTGFLGLVAVPAITALVQSAISAIIRPITSSLLSFSTGGRVDRPTTAIIGDAKKSGSFTNTEWIFNDRLIKMLTHSVIKDYTKTDFINQSGRDIAVNYKSNGIADIFKNDISTVSATLPKIEKYNIKFDVLQSLQSQTNKQLKEINEKLNDTIYNRELLRLRNIENSVNQKQDIIINMKSKRKRRPQIS